MEAAEELFSERGFDGVTVAEIAAAAGVSVKTLFQYFRSKEDLLFGDEGEMRDRLVASITGRPSGATPLRAVTDWLLVELDREGDSESLERYHRMVGDTPAVAARLLLMWEHYEQAVARALADEANEAVPSPRTRLVAAQLVSMVRVVTSAEVREFVSRHPSVDQRAARAEWIRAAGEIIGDGLAAYTPAKLS